MTDLWKMTETVLKHSPRTLLYGPPGTGKTRAGMRSGLNKDQHVYSITLTDETPAAELRGHFVPKNNEFIWMDGPVTRAMRQGARLVINEIDLASADCLTFLYSVCDDPELAMITLPTGEVITPAKGFAVVATMNGQPGDLPEALQDRFAASIHIDKPHPDAVKRLPKEFHNLAEQGVHNDPARRASVRSLLIFEALRANMADEIAAEAVFGNRASEVLNAMKLRKAKKPAATSNGR